MNTAVQKPFTIALWTRATFWGWLMGVALIIILSSLLDAVGIEGMQFYIGVGMGAGVGISQWMLVRKFHPAGTAWIWASLAGMGVPFIIFDVLIDEEITYKLPLCIASGGLLTGWLQYNLLKKITANARPWVAACFSGWLLAGLLVLTIDYVMAIKGEGWLNLALALLNLIIILAGGVVLGRITGYALKRMVFRG